MEQGTSLIPNRYSFNRVTAKASFTKTGDTGGIPLGVIDMTAMDEGASREKVMFPFNGNVVLGYDEVVSVAPIYTIKGKQMHDAILELVYMGTRNADVVQSAGSTQTFSFVAVRGRVFDIGARDVTLDFVKVGAATKVADVDYFFDAGNGQIRLPESPAGIADGNTVVVTFERPARTRISITAFNQLNQTGVLRLFEMDGFSALALSEASIAGSVSRDKGADGDPTKTNQWALKFSVTGAPTFTRRSTNT